jgi:hypothetical protein
MTWLPQIHHTIRDIITLTGISGVCFCSYLCNQEIRISENGSYTRRYPHYLCELRSDTSLCSFQDSLRDGERWPLATEHKSNRSDKQTLCNGRRSTEETYLKLIYVAIRSARFCR